jgi:hypothetical protein
MLLCLPREALKASLYIPYTGTRQAFTYRPSRMPPTTPPEAALTSREVVLSVITDPSAAVQVVEKQLRGTVTLIRCPRRAKTEPADPREHGRGPHHGRAPSGDPHQAARAPPDPACFQHQQLPLTVHADDRLP